MAITGEAIKMNESTLTKKIKNSFNNLFSETAIECYLIMHRRALDYKTLDFVSPSDSSIKIEFESIEDKVSEALEKKLNVIEIRHNDEKAFLSLFSFIMSDEEALVFIFLSRGKTSEKDIKILRFFSDITAEAYREARTTADSIATDEIGKHKIQIEKMREMQAKLFPKFNAVKNFDISSVFLPADLMTGNFVDGLYIDDTTYQIVACHVGGYDAAASFTGAAIRTLVRSEASRKMVPSQLIEAINTKLKNVISGIHSLVFLTIYQINTRTGKTMISSYGELTTVFYNLGKRGYVNLRDTNVGRLLAKRNFYKDISLVLGQGDMLLYYTKGFTEASSEDGRTLFGEEKMIEKFLEEKTQSSVNIVHSLSNALFEFTNYTPNQEDIILICIKRSLPESNEQIIIQKDEEAAENKTESTNNISPKDEKQQ